MSSNYNIEFEKLKNIKNTLYGKGAVYGGEIQKQKYSNYFVSINPLQVDTPEFRELFTFVLEVFFENIDKFITTFKGHPTDDTRDIQILPYMEVGEKYHRLHCHATIEISHRSKIKLNLAKIRKYFKTNLNLKGNINLNVQHYYKSRMTEEDKIKSYILKTFDKNGERSYREGVIDERLQG